MTDNKVISEGVFDELRIQSKLTYQSLALTDTDTIKLNRIFCEIEQQMLYAEATAPADPSRFARFVRGCLMEIASLAIAGIESIDRTNAKKTS